MRPDMLKQKLADFVAPKMRESGIDLWLTLTREGSRDPLADHFGGGSAVGRMGLAVVAGDGPPDLVAICASYDVSPLEETGLFADVQAYESGGWSEPLARLTAGAGRVAVNVSTDDPLADGLSHTLRGELVQALNGDEGRLVSAEPLVHELFARKTSAEIQRIRQAAVETDRILRWALSPEVLTPDDTTEAELADRILERVDELEAGLAWDAPFCPSVQFGRSRGHAAPGDRTVAPGELATIDFGIELDGYCSDIQRTLVVAAAGEVSPEIQRLWDTTRAAVDAAATLMRPGVAGIDVDAAARSIVHRAGYDDYIHATGHPLGYAVHDVGPMLGPNWPERYGRRVHGALKEGMVFTLEPSAGKDGRRIGLEEDVVVRAEGIDYLAPPQRDIWTYDPR